MAFADNVLQKRAKAMIDENFQFNYWELQSLLSKHDTFVKSYKEEIVDAIINGTDPSSEAILLLTSLRQQANKLVSDSRNTYYSAMYLQIVDTIFGMQDMYETLFNALSLLGVSEDEGFRVKQTYVEYMVPKDLTLSEIAEQILGSKEYVYEILENNTWAYNLTREELFGRIIKIPTSAVQKSALSTSTGKTSWGKDLPNEVLFTVEGDLQVLEDEEAFYQGIENIVKFPLGSVPEDNSIGNSAIEAVGNDVLSIDRGVAASLLRQAILTDTAVLDANIEDLSFKEDMLSCKVQVKPINSESVFQFTI